MSCSPVCPICADPLERERAARLAAEARAEKAEAALAKIDAVRNDIVGRQTECWYADSADADMVNYRTGASRPSVRNGRHVALYPDGEWRPFP